MYIHDSYIEAGRQLPTRERERYYRALLEFIMFNEEPNLSGAASAIFTAIRPAIELSKKRAKAGSKGGLKRAENMANDDFATKQKPSKSQASNEAKTQVASAIDISISTSTNNPIGEGGAGEGDSKPQKPKKHRHGEHGNVLLTDTELAKLQERFPTDWQSRIDNLDYYIGSKGARYASHYMTILSWARRDAGKGVPDDRLAKYRD